MIFVTTIHANEGKFEDTIRSLKRLKIPDGVKVREFLGLFGEPDAIIIFETQDEKQAVEFVCHIASSVTCKTSLALPIDEFRWTK
ncbi:MAG: GYD domain-containing protein [Candidatus Thermoplasmatota archaeon]|nr:hypothetical protein [Euryarchaeota archaeon]MBU4031611.1 GYD domain-containing protein [Candidatus Thermoplasmatota archaeon]MBU4072396.1 GYD domain-containing protein [Candidatus Thermoplasmatota archaeon]MBU4144931.1 GYD domain-containing protein [Candidatus Thermoplasmatota archaeon]MBU4591686.1 GYD domain-containing protein [Candidatus Thermoplasmatota archaeon]